MQNICTLRNKNYNWNLKIKPGRIRGKILRKNYCAKGFFYSLNEYKWTSHIRKAALPHGIKCAKIGFPINLKTKEKSK